MCIAIWLSRTVQALQHYCFTERTYSSLKGNEVAARAVSHGCCMHCKTDHSGQRACISGVQLTGRVCESCMRRGGGECLAEEVFCAGALEGAPPPAARPVAVYQRVVQIQHQRPHMPALETESSGD